MAQPRAQMAQIDRHGHFNQWGHAFFIHCLCQIELLSRLNLEVFRAGFAPVIVASPLNATLMLRSPRERSRQLLQRR